MTDTSSSPQVTTEPDLQQASRLSLVDDKYDASRFVKAVFCPQDLIGFRPMEIWTEVGKKRSKVDYPGVGYKRFGGRCGDEWVWNDRLILKAIEQILERSAVCRTNVFFGVCPRFGKNGEYDQAWQIRVVRALWSDVDGCSPEEALRRCEAAGLPRPSIVVNSGRGVHLYWILDVPYVIEDAGDPPPVFTEFVDQGEGKKKKRRLYLKDSATGNKVYIDNPQDRPALSPKAQYMQDALGVIASKIGGDHTTDLSRLLRLPGTMNRKDERNGQPPVPCSIFEIEPDRKYPIATFDHLANESPDKKQRDQIAKVRLPARRRVSAASQDKLHELLGACDISPVGDRSETDFALCCYAVEHGLTSGGVWIEAQHVGKFAESGEQYFLRTWEKAESHTREKIYQKIERKVASGHTKHGSKDHAVSGHAANVRDTKELPSSFALTDTGLAERFAAGHGANVRYCYEWGKWLYYDGRQWNCDCLATIEHAAKQTARAIYEEAANETDDDARDRIVQFAMRAESARARAAMVQLARSEPGIPVQPRVLDTDPFLLNTATGTLDLRTGNARPHSAADMLTKLCPVAYDPNATCPTWVNCLDRYFGGDASLVDFIQRLCGYCLSGSVEEQILPIFHGAGQNGKSTFIDVILKLLGPDYGMKAASDFLMMKKGDSHPTDKTDLCGKRLVACVETDDNRRLSESLVKELTGGDAIRARRMREDFWQFDPTHKVILATNHKPVVRGTDLAIWRRLRLVPFDVTIPPADRDKRLVGKLLLELPGILAWAVRGCLDWQRNGLNEPAAVMLATESYQKEQDTLGEFISGACELESNSRGERASVLLAAYRSWTGDQKINSRQFSIALTERGFVKYTNNGTYYRGIRLSSPVLVGKVDEEEREDEAAEGRPENEF